MLPVVVIVGKPNVGKSTLFNRLTKTRQALISDFAGTTRDRQYGQADLMERRFIVIDTGGMTENVDEIDKLITKQVRLAIDESDHIIFLVDGKNGITSEDKAIASFLRTTNKSLTLAINKTENIDPILALNEGFELGLGQPIALSTAHGQGVENLITKIFPKVTEIAPEDLSSIKIAIVGKPNVGKSTLTNKILGEERVIVHDSPGTTRDSIFIPVERHGKNYTLIDTAGVRKRKKVRGAEVPEKFSVVKTLQAIENSHVVLYMIDGTNGASEQDLKLLGFILDCGKALVLAVNKWDQLSDREKQQIKMNLDRHFNFIHFVRLHFISALHGSGVGNIFESIDEAYRCANIKLTTGSLNKLLQQAQLAHSPPLISGRRIKLRYAHLGGHNPPRIIIHGNQVTKIPESYRKFLASYFQEKLKLYGTPIRIEFKLSENPYKK